MGSKRQLFIAGANLTVLAGSLVHADRVHGEKPRFIAGSIESEANEVSLRSIEKTWAQVPMMCKDRSFNAEPHAVPAQLPKSEIMALYEA